MWRMFLLIKETNNNPNKFTWLNYWIIQHYNGTWSLMNRELKTTENLKVVSFKGLISKMEEVWQKHLSKSEAEA